MSKILYTKPSITDLEIDYVNDAIQNGWGKNCYDYINKFENSFKKHIGSSYSIATSSCTGALHLGLAALNIGRGDEVILSDINWVATLAPIIHLGAKPVFVDILDDSWCLDPSQVKKVINSKTKAIIATHLYGNLCDMDQLMKIGDEFSIPIIEDSAEALGSIYKDMSAGSIGEFGVFSFHGTKTITTGEGGIFVTNNKDLYNKVLTLSNHGRKKGEKKQFWAETIGYKFKMSNIDASLGLAQLERIKELVQKKREILHKYQAIFDDKTKFKMNNQKKNEYIGAWMPTLVFDKALEIQKEDILEYLNNIGIHARPFFYPLSSLPEFKNNSHNKVAYDISNRSINLPSYHDMSSKDIEKVAKHIYEFLKC